MLKVVCFLALIGSCSAVSAGATDWGYEDAPDDQKPAKWGDKYGDCNKKRQSPIHIHSDKVEKADLSEIDLDAWDLKDADEITLDNKGYTFNAYVPKNKSFTSGGALSGQYALAQFHPHWGKTNAVGSEHLIDGKQYAAEFHFVNFHNAYTDDQHLKESDGAAVLGVMIEGGGAENAAYKPIIDGLANIKYKGQTHKIKGFDLKTLLPSDRKGFYRYEGSLTTPPCSEAVIWTVFHNSVKVSDAQLAKLRELQDGDQNSTTAAIVNNFRAPQPLHMRKVKSSEAPPPKPTPTTAGASAVVLSVFALLPLFYHLH